MNEALLDDLKQFMTATVAQSEARLRTDFQATVEQAESRLRTTIAEAEARLVERMDDGFGACADAFETLSKQADDDQKASLDRHRDHKTRLRRLEQSTA